MRRRAFAYQLCDVFTTHRLAGNQLAVFVDAGGLSTDEMQALARETNLSETTFIVRRDASVERERGVLVRIFTTEEELPFAGHPTLGTATVIRALFPEWANAERVVLDLKAGRVPVAFHRSGGIERGVMTQPRPVFGRTHKPEELAPLLGLAVEDLHAELLPQTVSTGLPFCVVPLRSVEALTRLRVDGHRANEYLARVAAEDADGPHAKFFYVIAEEGAHAWRSRMQFYNGEDPATGSAAGCATAYLAARGVLAEGAELHLRQGIEMRRPSDIYSSFQRNDATVSEVRVGGSTVLVAEGRFFLD
ncbi:PhzF family phenazine biosynthesis protein [Silvibacterium dinghuense]|uniref:PhzF family phenazine biosynthesis protein n=1 Tax=Silvibacterium dinghuense TaxID=1560006 RepID=UPI001E3C6D15|nr:PhzF family phenazine biosynthesis protein [Silvibacterium dinghuense]